MTVLGRYREARNVESPSYPLTSQALVDLFTRKVSSGVSVSEDSALSVPAVKRAVDLIAGIGAGLPMKVFRDRAGTRTDVTGDYPVLKEPYPWVTPFEFWELAYRDLVVWGNFFCWKTKNELGDTVVRLLRLPPWQVTVERDEQTSANPGGRWYRIGAGNEQRYGPAEIMHICGPSADGLVGSSLVRVGAEAIGVALAAEQTAASMFGDGLLFAGILTSDQDLDQPAAETLGARFRKMIGSKGPGARIPVLGRSTKFQPVNMEPERAQFLESRAFQVLEISRLTGVDPALLMDPTAVMNFGEPQRQNFLDFTMEMWLRRVEQAVTLHLTPRGSFGEYTRGAFLRADTKTRYETYARAAQFGILTRNEIRALENFEPLDGLDEPLTPANLGGAANEQPVSGETPAPDGEVPVGS